MNNDVQVTSAVPTWFGAAYSHLPTPLQELHLHGGTLSGKVDLQIKNHFLARRLVKKLGLPQKRGTYPFTVHIQHDCHRMSWRREFSDITKMTSIFTPVGEYPDGYWREKTAGLELHLKVKVDDNTWHWIPWRTYLFGVRIPQWLVPKVTAFKKVDGKHYAFSVSIKVPVLGELLRYSGRLRCKVNGQSFEK